MAEKPPGKAPWDSIRHNSVLDPESPDEASTPDSGMYRGREQWQNFVASLMQETAMIRFWNKF